VKTMCWNGIRRPHLVERSGMGEVSRSLTRTVMKTDARVLKQGA